MMQLSTANQLNLSDARKLIALDCKSIHYNWLGSNVSYNKSFVVMESVGVLDELTSFFKTK